MGVKLTLSRASFPHISLEAGLKQYNLTAIFYDMHILAGIETSH